MNETYKVQIQDLVDDLKAVFTHAGLGGEAGEYKLLTQSFLYKFLNDKFLYQAKVLDESNTYENLLAMSEKTMTGFWRISVPALLGSSLTS